MEEYVTVLTRKQAIPAVMVLTVCIVAAGCTRNPANQVRQQGTQMQEQVRQGTNRLQATIQPQATNPGDSVDIANKAADRIVRLNGVKRANVLVVRQNAYVAAAVDVNQGQVTRDLEDQIAGEVRAENPNIKNVYVSTNPEFVDRVNKYVTDVGQGRPVSGFIEEFNTMVERIFPNAR